jgi:lysozyme
MKVNQKGLDLLKHFEGLSLTSYKDIVGRWTIGYGITEGVVPGMVITVEQAQEMLQNALEPREAAVSAMIKVPVTEDEFSALVLLAYNVGLANFKKSTLLKLLNAGDKSGCAKEFPKWNRAGGKEVAGLTRRRLAEQALFLGT